MADPVGNVGRRQRLQFFLFERCEDPEEQEECHHRSHEVCVGNFPGTAMVPMTAFLDYSVDDDRTFVFVCDLFHLAGNEMAVVAFWAVN